MKKVICCLLAVILAGMVLCPVNLRTFAAAEDMEFEDDFGEEFDDGDTEEEAAESVYTGPEYEYEHLVVGNPTPLSGNFTTQMWGYNTSDVDITALINAYNLVYWDYGTGNFQTDPTAVSGVNVMEDEKGNRTYMLAIQQGLTYSDGTPITAADYAFSILLSVAPQVRELGGDTENYAWIPGVKEYRDGTAQAVDGVHVLSEYMLAVTVSAEWLPFFYELGLLWCYPMPMHLIAPGCSLTEGEEGVHISGEFTTDLLRETLLNEKTGYVSHPQAVSGPYQLISFNKETATAEFVINNAYIGNRDGILPTIEWLTVVPVSNDTMMDELAAGKIGLLNKVTLSDSVLQGIGLVGTQNYAFESYPRTGMSFISFNCEKETVSSEAVRQAMAMCLDKEETVSRYTGNYGIRVDGYYGIGQWMYQAMAGSLGYPGEAPADDAGAGALQAYEEAEEAWGALKEAEIRRYELDPEGAAKLLEENGWTLNEAGEPFDPAKDAVRCKEIDGQRIALRLKGVCPADTKLGSVLEETFVPYLAQAGIVLELEGMDWQKLLNQYYRQEERNCDIMVLASNFSEVFDPRNVFNPADAETGMNNYTGIRDEELYRLAQEMSRTEPGDYLGYMERWLVFQNRFQEIVPMISIYGNAYFDFYTRYLKDYEISAEVTWSQAVVPAYLSDPGSPEEE